MDVNSGEATTNSVDLSRDDAAEQFLKKWTDDAGTEPSESTPPPAAEEPEAEAETEVEVEADESESNSEAETEESEETDEDPQDDDSASIKDDAKVKLTVDGEEVEVSVKDLKRLYGQEASLTKKSQAVAETQKQLAQAQEYVENTLELMLAQAQERVKPYENIDWVVASKRLTEEELTALRTEAQAAYRDYQTVTEKVQEYAQRKQEQSSKELEKVIKAAHEELSNPDTGIKDWGKQKHAELSEYAKSLGFPQEVVDTFVTAPVWKLLDRAMRFDKGQQVVTKKINKSPQNVVKATKKAPAQEAVKNARAKAALDRLRESGGSRDAAADAFLSRWMKD